MSCFYCQPIKPQSLVSVSYTHLDVYKRQIQDQALLEQLFDWYIAGYLNFD